MNIPAAAFLGLAFGLFDPNRDWHAEAGHAVQDVAADFRLGPLIGQSPGMKAPTDDGHISIHRRLDQTAPAVSRTTLPSKPSVLFDRTKMAISLRCAGVTQHRCRSRRDDYARRRVSLQHLIINPVAIIGTVRCHRPDGLLDLVQQARQCQDITDVARVGSTAATFCVLASTARCSLRRRRERTPCF